jgi:ribosomal protein S18 acetylase RimI-like enzyme
MHIRYYTNEDKKQVILLWKKVFFDAPPWAEPSILLKKKLEVDNLVFVAEDNGKVIGSSMAGYDGYSAWVYSVAVEPEHRMKGVGKELVQFATEVLKGLGAIKVGLQVDSNNKGVIEFYKSMGFEIEDRINMSRMVD